MEKKRSDCVKVDAGCTNLFVFRRWRRVAAVFPFFFAGFAIQISYDEHEAGRTSTDDRGLMSVAALVLARIMDPLWYRPG